MNLELGFKIPLQNRFPRGFVEGVRDSEMDRAHLAFKKLYDLPDEFIETIRDDVKSENIRSGDNQPSGLSDASLYKSTRINKLFLTFALACEKSAERVVQINNKTITKADLTAKSVRQGLRKNGLANDKDIDKVINATKKTLVHLAIATQNGIIHPAYKTVAAHIIKKNEDGEYYIVDPRSDVGDVSFSEKNSKKSTSLPSLAHHSNIESSSGFLDVNDLDIDDGGADKPPIEEKSKRKAPINWDQLSRTSQELLTDVGVRASKEGGENYIEDLTPDEWDVSSEKSTPVPSLASHAHIERSSGRLDVNNLDNDDGGADKPPIEEKSKRKAPIDWDHSARTSHELLADDAHRTSEDGVLEAKAESETLSESKENSHTLASEKPTHRRNQRVITEAVIIPPLQPEKLSHPKRKLISAHKMNLSQCTLGLPNPSHNPDLILVRKQKDAGKNGSTDILSEKKGCCVIL